MCVLAKRGARAVLLVFLCGILAACGGTSGGGQSANRAPTIDLNSIPWNTISPDELTTEIATVKGKKRWTALHHAARETTAPDVFRKLVELGGDINAKASNRNRAGRTGYTPLMIAAENTSDPEILRLLVELGADIHARTRDSGVRFGTALHFAACCNRNPGIIPMLVELGADVNAKTETQRTIPLNWAVDTANERAIIDLLDAGSNAKHRDRSGNNVFQHDSANRTRMSSDSEARRRLREAVYK